MLSLHAISIHLHHLPLILPFSADIGPGEVITVMGGSGAGKTSLLAYIGGEVPWPLAGSGRVDLDGRDLTGLPPEQRRIGRLFQDDLLFPHLTVAENLAFGLPRGARRDREALVHSALADAALEGFGGRPPHTLSAGQRARVALFRALLARPAAMLLDEPFSKLDVALRAQMRAFVFRHLLEQNIPALLVTHDRADVPDGGRVLTITPGGGVTDA